MEMDYNLKKTWPFFHVLPAYFREIAKTDLYFVLRWGHS